MEGKRKLPASFANQNDRRSLPFQSNPGFSSSSSTQALDVNHAVLTAYATFDALGLKPLLLKGIYAYGYAKPSAIQQRAIKPILQGRDVVAQSQSGTGKTAVFSISALQMVEEKVRVFSFLFLFFYGGDWCVCLCVGGAEGRAGVLCEVWVCVSRKSRNKAAKQNKKNQKNPNPPPPSPTTPRC